MKNLKNNMNTIKSIIKIAIIIIVLILIGVFSLSYTINKNQDYSDNIIQGIQKNYKIDNKINYVNKYGNYYIITTDTNVIVLNKEYQQELKENINVLAENKENYQLIYKTKKLMYEDTIIKDNKLTYVYYDAKTHKKLSSTTLEQ